MKNIINLRSASKKQSFDGIKASKVSLLVNLLFFSKFQVKTPVLLKRDNLNSGS